VHIFKFADDAAQEVHSQSDHVKRFEPVYSPESVSKGVEFVDYD
jgi:quinol monooxygenase YgiN